MTRSVRGALIALLYGVAAGVHWRPVRGVHPDDLRAAWGGLCVNLCTRPTPEVM